MIMVMMAALRSRLNERGAEDLGALPMLERAIASAIQGTMVSRMPVRVWRSVQGALSSMAWDCVCLLLGDESIKGVSFCVCFYRVFRLFISYHRWVERAE